MRIICALIFVLLHSSCSSATMTEELLKAQNELNIAFEFTELYLMNNMDLWVGNMTMLTGDYFLTGFFKVRSDIFEITDETTKFINNFEPVNPTCRDDVLRRWIRQADMVANRLQNCMRIVKGIAAQEFYEITIYHPDAQRLVAHTPNQGLNILSTSSIWDPPNTLYKSINRRLRQLLGRAVPWLLIMDELEDLLMHHIDTAKIMSQRCYDSVINNFKAESSRHINLVQNC